MSPFEYAVGLVAIVIGLAIGDLATSLHRLIRAGARVRWNLMTPLSGVFVLLVVAGMWFDVWAIRDTELTLRYPFFLTILIELGLLFLLAAAAFPDSTDEATDLHAFYQSNARYFWSVYALYRASYMGHWFYFWALRGAPSERALWSFATSVAPLLLALPMLVWPRKLAIHYPLLLANIALNLIEFWDKDLHTAG